MSRCRSGSRTTFSASSTAPCSSAMDSNGIGFGSLENKKWYTRANGRRRAEPLGNARAGLHVAPRGHPAFSHQRRRRGPVAREAWPRADGGELACCSLVGDPHATVRLITFWAGCLPSSRSCSAGRAVVPRAARIRDRARAARNGRVVIPGVSDTGLRLRDAGSHGTRLVVPGVWLRDTGRRGVSRRRIHGQPATAARHWFDAPGIECTVHTDVQPLRGSGDCERRLARGG